jgi:hypothetical protein
MHGLGRNTEEIIHIVMERSVGVRQTEHPIIHITLCYCFTIYIFTPFPFTNYIQVSVSEIFEVP